MQKNADLHIHSRFAMAASPKMTPENIINGCRTKGIDVIGTGDALHNGWRTMWNRYIYDSNTDDIVIVPQTEVEDESRVHHVILMENFGQFEDLEKKLEPYCDHLRNMGRPHINLSGEKIAEFVHDLDGMIGPAHAFTPWTSLFASYSKPSDCYGDEKIDFCELGLSADSSYGAGIEEFKDIPFLSNSDAHSYYPEKLGREFTRINISKETPEGVLKSIRNNKIIFNAGFFPEEGKYNRTACTRCYAQFSLIEAESLKWKCPHDKGRIKLGVKERSEKLSSIPPTKRPPYIKIIPLGEVISRVLCTSSPCTKKCRSMYNEFVYAFSNEISVLMDVSYEELCKVSKDAADAIISMRNGRVKLYPGGGGKYGSFEF